MADTKDDPKTWPENDQNLPPEVREHHRRVRLEKKSKEQQSE